jgi:hypothetical protein
MANDDSSNTDESGTLRTLLQEATVAAEIAGRRLQSAQHELTELTKMLEDLSEVATSLAPVTEQLSDLTLDAARLVMANGEAGSPFLALVAELSELARTSARALADLESCVRGTAAGLHTAIEETQWSTIELHRIAPALQAASQQAAPAPPATPAIPAEAVEAAGAADKVVALQLKLASRGSGDREADRRPTATLIPEVWPAMNRRRDGLN